MPFSVKGSDYAVVAAIDGGSGSGGGGEDGIAVEGLLVELVNLKRRVRNFLFG
ncbi:hypothetical protein N9891_00415 [bacterium]|nr:hypothetical protein [bacterium]